MACHHSHESQNILVQYVLDSDILGISGISIIFALFIYGVIGSFTHCIGMCGPIALGQMNIRLMHLKKEQLNNLNKLNCALSLPYYFGKAITYGILALLTKYLSASFGDNIIFKNIAGIILIISAVICLKISVIKIVKIKSIPSFYTISKYFKFLESCITNIIKKLSLNPFGIQGLFMGMILGLIPCGLVLSAIMITTSYSKNIFVSFFSMFFFGLGTFPALFIISYFGQQIMLKAQKYLNAVFSIFMFVNFLLLLNFAIELLK